MKLTEQGLQNRKSWEQAGYELPNFDRAEVTKKTMEAPKWIHFGAGNIFRAFQANAVQQLLNQGLLDTGLIVAEGYDYEIIEKMNRPHDNLSILVTLKTDGQVEKTVVGSVVESLILNREDAKEFTRLQEIFCNDTLQMASFTITEKGYSLVNGAGEQLPAVKADMQAGPEQADSYIGKIAALLYTRYQAGEKPIAMVSMDNCSHNGDKLYAAISDFAEEWKKRGLVEPGFVAYVKNPQRVSFPWSMIDKITPRPDASVQEILQKDQIEGLEPVVTSKNTYIAPYVNAEECQYLVIEDAFPGGHPGLEQAGIIFTARETVDKVEKMKVCTCLNPLHTTLAIFGCLLGYTQIFQEMDNPMLKKLVERIGYEEGLPVAVDPGILSPRQFIDEVVNVRIPNPFMPDTPQRIATDTSQKLAIRFGETIKAYEKSKTLHISDLQMIPLVFAGWLRYLLATDDEGKSFPLSPDPLLETVCPYVQQGNLKPLLQRKDIFGVDLYQAGMGELVETYFSEMCTGKGAIAVVLQKYV